MSRALEPEVIAAVKNGDHAQIYKDISSALLDFSEPHEIEILGKSFLLLPGQNLVRDGVAIGIPKLRLVQAFFVARKIIMDDTCRVQTLPSDNIRAATAVMLLMDPEHLTAANTRKRFLLKDLNETQAPDQARIAEIIRRERCFVDSLLTSPLHRHTKSPCLWSHRRWLVEEQARRCMHVSSSDVQDTLSRVVMIAGVKHPRNYYAWCHARWLVWQVAQNPQRQSRTGTDDEAAVDTGVFEDIAYRVRDWCYRNNGDISGWCFLLFMLGICISHDGGELSRRMRQEVSELAERMQWRNESVVWFLDMAAHQDTAADS
jgi:protein prenyltransferase alpha subunit repeat containing protein 1